MTASSRKAHGGKTPFDANPRPTFAAMSSWFMNFESSGLMNRRTWQTDHTFFCDETGNSGGRFFHPEQPIYAEGGWVVSHENRPEAMALVESLEQKNGFTAKTKGTALKSSPRGRAHIAEVFDGLRQIALPFVYLVEKRYFVCAKAVETYFDPFYNAAIDPAETWDPEQRQERAERLYAAPDSVVSAFAEAYRMQDPQAVRAAGEDWEEWLIVHHEEGLATELRVSLQEIGRHLQAEWAPPPDRKVPPGIDSLNLPAMSRVFQLAEQNLPPCEMVHDRCASFEAVYHYVYDLVRNAKAAEVTMADGRKQSFGFRRLNSLSFGDSEIQPLLRAADYQVACCVDFAKQSFDGQEVARELAQLAYPGLGAILVWGLSCVLPERASIPQLGEVMASEAFVGRVFKNLTRLVRPESKQ